MGKKTDKKPVKKAEQQPFWKKISPEIKSLTDHLGHFVDNMKTNDWADLAILASLAYLSFDILGKRIIKEKQKVLVGYTPGYTVGYIGPGMERERVPQPIYEEQEVERTEYNPRMALVGPIAYKLATTMGGAPPVSQIAGIAMLSALGLKFAAGNYIDIGGGLKIGIPTLEDLMKTITG